MAHALPDPLEGSAGSSVKTGLAALVASVVRTVVPLLVGLIVSVATKLGVPIQDADAALVVNGLVTIALAGGYYLVVRLLELFASSKFGWLLGFAKSPVYVPGAVAALSDDRTTVKVVADPLG